MNLNALPSTYIDAAVTNLFYWNNVMHDVWYQYGFDEPAGNFQFNNYGKGGEEGDYIRAQAQDGGGTNNANFSSGADGSNARIQMYLWTG
ncbi:M36 family metallopeptidase, partial [Arthrospira platensis SPKY1]|nr:M36 family metallopeptidase [Arthrospira platensis SPKY1]